MIYRGCEITKHKGYYFPKGSIWKTKTLKFSKAIVDAIADKSETAMLEWGGIPTPMSAFVINAEGDNSITPDWKNHPRFTPERDGKGMTFFERLDYDLELLKRSRAN